MFTPYLKIIGSETTGTGFFASPEYIVTCKHVIENCSAGDIVSIKFDDDDELYASLLLFFLFRQLLPVCICRGQNFGG